MTSGARTGDAPGAGAAERIALRRWTVDDAPAFHAIWGDPRVIWWGAAADVEASRAVIARVTARCAGEPALGWFAIVVRGADVPGGEIVGSASIQPAPDPPGGIELGWHVAYDAQGRGHATAAAHALIAHARAHGVTRVIATIIPFNHASIAVATRVGMRPVGVMQRLDMAHVVFALEL